LFWEIFTPVIQTAARSGRRLNTSILIRTNDESGVQVVCHLTVEGKCVGSSVMDEYWPNLFGKPA